MEMSYSEIVNVYISGSVNHLRGPDDNICNIVVGILASAVFDEVYKLAST